MKYKNVLRQLIAEGPYSCIPRLERMQPGLHALIASSGYECRRDETYEWNGLQRGPTGHALFQYTLEGEGLLEYEGLATPVRPGQGMVLSIPHRHRYWLPEGGHWSFIYITLFGRETVRLLRHVAQQHRGLLKLPRTHSLVQATAQTILDLKQDRLRSTTKASVRAYTLAMLVLEAGKDKVADPGLKALSPAIKQSISYFTQHLSKAVGVTEMAREAGLTRSHFSRLFKASTGLSPMDYIVRERLQHAQTLLQTTTLPLDQVAKECGYRDTSYFIRAFRQYYDLDPANLRITSRE